MAQQASTDDANRTAVDVQVRYSVGGHSVDADVDQDSEAFQLALDLKGFGPDAFEEFSYDPQHAIENGTEAVATATLHVEEDVQGDALAERIYHRMQGGRLDEELGYDGSRIRSMMVGDVVILDGDVRMVAGRGFEQLDVDVEDL